MRILAIATAIVVVVAVYAAGILPVIAQVAQALASIA